MNFKEIMNTVLFEEIGKLFKDKINGYEFRTKRDERNEPHFHFIKNEIDGCIALLYKGYYKHGNHNSELDKNTENIIFNWLSNLDNYKYACEEWNGVGQLQIDISKITNETNPYFE